MWPWMTEHGYKPRFPFVLVVSASAKFVVVGYRRVGAPCSINDIIRRALVSAGVPAVLEPIGLVRDDGKRPDGMTIMPWKLGRPLVWDATRVNTLAPSHLPSTTCCDGAAITGAENIKRRKYNNFLGSYYIFNLYVRAVWG